MKNVAKFLFLLALQIPLYFFAEKGAFAETIPPSIFNEPSRWKTESGQEVTFSHWKGQRLIVTMAYTSCRMTCPITMRRLKRVQAKLDEQGIQAEIIFVTLDPATDQSEKLASYKKSWGITRANWHFLNGTLENTRKLSRLLKIRFEDVGGHIVHDNKVVVLSELGAIDRSLDDMIGTF